MDKTIIVNIKDGVVDNVLGDINARVIVCDHTEGLFPEDNCLDVGNHRVFVDEGVTYVLHKPDLTKKVVKLVDSRKNLSRMLKIGVIHKNSFELCFSSESLDYFVESLIFFSNWDNWDCFGVLDRAVVDSLIVRLSMAREAFALRDKYKAHNTHNLISVSGMFTITGNGSCKVSFSFEEKEYLLYLIHMLYDIGKLDAEFFFKFKDLLIFVRGGSGIKKEM